MAAPTVGITVIKRFTYRGNANEEFSNKYLLTGTTPASSAAWRTLFDALVTAEKTVYPSSVSVIRGYGYNSPAEDATAVWSVDLTQSPNTPVNGTLSTSGSMGPAPGDAAVWVRWKLDRLNSNGKYIYLRKYFHPAIISSSGANDTILAGQLAALNALGAKLDDGTFAESRTITDRLGTATVGHGGSTYITTRTLKRRGKRNPTG